MRITTFQWGGADYVLFSRPIRRPSRFAGLTPSELALVEALLAGQPRAAIAEERGVKMRTVTNQLNAAYRKLGISGATELRAMVHHGHASD